MGAVGEGREAGRPGAGGRSGRSENQPGRPGRALRNQPGRPGRTLRKPTREPKSCWGVKTRPTMTPQHGYDSRLQPRRRRGGRWARRGRGRGPPSTQEAPGRPMGPMGGVGGRLRPGEAGPDASSSREAAADPPGNHPRCSAFWVCLSMLGPGSPFGPVSPCGPRSPCGPGVPVSPGWACLLRSLILMDSSLMSLPVTSLATMAVPVVAITSPATKAPTAPRLIRTQER